MFLTGDLTSQERVIPTGCISGKIKAPEMDETSAGILEGRKFERYKSSHTSDDPAPYSLPEKCVVYLTGVVDPTPPESLARAKLDQRDMMFRPLVLPIMVGTSVDFPNNDLLFHNVFSFSKSKEFDLGRYPKGKSKSILFEKPGIVRVYCDIHTYMNATVLVLENRYFATPKTDGSYQICNIPPGRYTLNFWFGRKIVEQREIDIRANEETQQNFDVE